MEPIFDTAGNRISLYDTAGNLLIGLKSGGGAVEDVDTSSLTLLRQVTNNTGYHRTLSTAGPEGVVVVVEHEVRALSKAPRLNLTISSTWNDSPSLVKRAGLVVDGTFHPATVDGVQEFQVPVKQRVLTDPMRDDLVLMPGTKVYSVVEHNPGSIYGIGTLSMPYSVSTVSPGGFSGSVPPLTSRMVSGSPTGLYALVNPEDSSRVVSVVGLGDSFMDPGWFRFGVENNGLAWSDWSVWLDPTHTEVDSAMADRMPAEGPTPYDIAFIGWGGNDRSADLDAWNRKTIASWRFFESRGQRVACKTLHPYTNSTDKWASAEGQTLKAPAVEPARVERNNWLRDGAPIDSADNPLPTGTTDPGAIRIGDEGHPVKYPVFDEADTCETERNSGLWRFDGGQWTTDGAHLTAHGNAMMADAFTQWVADNLT